MQNSISQIPRTFLRQLVSVFVVSALLFGILGQGWAQSVNIDIGRNWGPPANAFGAAAGQAGVWNNINAVGTRDIVDLGGATTDIDLTLGPAFEGNASGPPTTDAERLVGDMFYVCRSFPYCGPPSWSVQMTGVENGAYDVYVYAPSHSSVPTGNFTVNGIDVANLSGAFSGEFVEGVNYALVPKVVVSSGVITVTGSSPTSFSGISGMQLVTTELSDPPTADAGPDQSIRAGDTVFLDGSASFDDNTPSELLEYHWMFIVKPTGSAANLDDATVSQPSFVADLPGTFVLSLTVTDEDGLESDPDFVEVSSDNLAPTAVATVDYSLAVVGETVHFDGSGSTDPESDPLTYSWSITQAPPGSTAALVGSNTVAPSLTLDLEGVYEVTLVVSDFLGPSAPASVEVVATTATEFAEIVVLEASDEVVSLTAEQVTTEGNQIAFDNFLTNAIKQLQKGKVANATRSLQLAIIRTDGCALRGSPDVGYENDWITDCDAQQPIYELLRAAIDALED